MSEDTFCDLCGLHAEVLKITLPPPPVDPPIYQKYLICKECADTIFQTWSEWLDKKYGSDR